MALVTLTTDFGTSSPYVAALKGALLTVDPQARLVDLGHDLPPQDVRHAAYFLAQAVPFFPIGTIHVCVVDPGVGTERALLLAEAGGQRLLAPDNGVLTFVLQTLSGPAAVRRLSDARFWRPTPSSTFHGRDIFAPVAGHLSRGASPESLGPIVDAIVRLEEPAPRSTAAGIDGEVTFIDSFGNLITNIPAGQLPSHPFHVRIAGRPATWVRTYGEAGAGMVVALVGSHGRLEIAVVNGNAARSLSLGAGAKVSLTQEEPSPLTPLP